MTELEALRIFVKYAKSRKHIVAIIQGWNPKLSIRDNANAVGADYSHSQHIAKRYGLKYVKIGKNHGLGGPKRG